MGPEGWGERGEEERVPVEFWWVFAQRKSRKQQASCFFLSFVSQVRRTFHMVRRRWSTVEVLTGWLKVELSDVPGHPRIVPKVRRSPPTKPDVFQPVVPPEDRSPAVAGSVGRDPEPVPKKLQNSHQGFEKASRWLCRRCFVFVRRVGEASHPRPRFRTAVSSSASGGRQDPVEQVGRGAESTHSCCGDRRQVWVERSELEKQAIYARRQV